MDDIQSYAFYFWRKEVSPVLNVVVLTVFGCLPRDTPREGWRRVAGVGTGTSGDVCVLEPGSTSTTTDGCSCVSTSVWEHIGTTPKPTASIRGNKGSIRWDLSPCPKYPSVTILLSTSPSVRTLGDLPQFFCDGGLIIRHLQTPCLRTG